MRRVPVKSSIKKRILILKTSSKTRNWFWLVRVWYTAVWCARPLILGGKICILFVFIRTFWFCDVWILRWLDLTFRAAGFDIMDTFSILYLKFKNVSSINWKGTSYVKLEKPVVWNIREILILQLLTKTTKQCFSIEERLKFRRCNVYT